MAEEKQANPEEQLSAGPVVLTDLPIGARVRVRSGAVGEVTANPRDGGWIFLRYVESEKDPTKVGEEDMVFCTDVMAVVPAT